MVLVVEARRRVPGARTGACCVCRSAWSSASPGQASEGRLRTKTGARAGPLAAAGAGLGTGLCAGPSVAVPREGAVLPSASAEEGLRWWPGGSVSEVGILSAVWLALGQCVMFERKL